MTIEQELISRYKAWLLRDVPSPYNKSKLEWVQEVWSKIKELEIELKTNK